MPGLDLSLPSIDPGSYLAELPDLSLSWGGVTFPDGSYQLPNGVVMNADGTLKLPDGGSWLADGSIEMPDGSIILPDGSIRLADGNITLPNGVIKTPEGKNCYRYLPGSFSQDCILKSDPPCSTQRILNGSS